MRSLTFFIFLTLSTFGHGVMIGYLRIREPLEPDFEPKLEEPAEAAELVEPVEPVEPEEPVELIEPNIMQRLYYTKMIPILLGPISPKKNRFTSFGGFGGFGLRFWKTSVLK